MAKKQNDTKADAKVQPTPKKSDAEREAEAAIKEAEKAKKAAEAKAAKAKAEAEKQAKHTVALNQMAPVAKEINTRLEKAAKLEHDADDHRLAAALRLADAEKIAKDSGVNFKTWAEGNLVAEGRSYETIRKLVAVGKADDPALALADMRGKNKDANKKARAKSKATDSTGKEVKAIGAKSNPFVDTEQAIARLDDKTRRAVIEAAAAKDAMVVMPKEKADALSERSADVAGMVKLFKKLAARDQMKFLKLAAAEIGATVSTEFDVDSGPSEEAKAATGPDDGMAIPEALRGKKADAPAA